MNIEVLAVHGQNIGLPHISIGQEMDPMQEVNMEELLIIQEAVKRSNKAFCKMSLCRRKMQGKEPRSEEYQLLCRTLDHHKAVYANARKELERGI